ncbi:MAG TPA: radical SAM protein [Casimicrobiaceae bacterium]|jgi:MoaA/NifB/PqqE/SkfB family radical SAM enzyme
MTWNVDRLKAPLFVSWQITRDCDLCCLHCCTESAPGKRLADELDADEAIALGEQIVRCEVPYVMLCGGEPLLAPHFFELAETLGRGGVQLKIETNGQRLDDAVAERLARLPVRSVQISLDADTPEVYARQRPGGSLAKAHAACRAVRAAGMPLEITFAPTRLNIDHAERVLERARGLGAFRFNTGRLMRIGTAARLWDRLEPPDRAYEAFFAMLEGRKSSVEGGMELCYIPFDIRDSLRTVLAEPPATLLILPNGWVKVVAALPHVCADLRRQSFAEAWDAYRDALRQGTIRAAIHRAVEDESSHAECNTWQLMRAVVHA